MMPIQTGTGEVVLQNRTAALISQNSHAVDYPRRKTAAEAVDDADRGADDPGSNSVKRAVACALTMDVANEMFIAPVLRNTGVPPLRFRTSMDHGWMTIARIGAPQRFSANVAIGNTANFASKMLGRISPDDIGLGASACARLPPYWKATWAKQSPIQTGWTFVGSDTPYPLYLYTGRWSRLI
jgi:class 3 adenylate cyclase